MTKNMQAAIACSPWAPSQINDQPKRILVMRHNCFGDLIATFPYINSLRAQLGSDVEIDLVVCDIYSHLAEHIGLFDNVIKLGGGFNTKKRFVFSLAKIPYLLLRNYDVVLDLQNNKISRITRYLLGKKPYTEFDKYSPLPAGERYRKTINAVGITPVELNTDYQARFLGNCNDLLTAHGWRGEKYVILNPAGAYENRNWPAENYIAFAKLWLKNINDATQFVFLGHSERIGNAVNIVQQALPNSVINLLDMTSETEAFEIVRKAEFMLSEDSGLMHMAWTTGVKTIAMLGSTRADWTQPLGKQVDFFSSSDLSCGDCMQPTCERGDNYCMTRITPPMVLAKYTALTAAQTNGG
ncbi:Uncharacterised protein [BD1-7 clade bacterium]|uniref:ADP-heptose--LPS heptosyltransferase 2 n=1 Tax=BD1-7 clade bacterium TaxID=2029982 RepID=A0A5S9PCK7_9GAMM|nr:Uncharacterised protein [BD1-7 clade bacterium]CAA0101338.1 Uncharacterised protein [BD1-7 clade bacterium]